MNPSMARFLKPSNIRGNKVKMLGTSSLMTLGGAGMTVLDAKQNHDDGDDWGTAVFKSAATTLAWSRAPYLMAGITVARAMPDLVSSYTQWKKGKEEWWNQTFYRGTVGGQYQDTQRAMTMRQAAVEQIQGSKMNARSALGGEARILSENFHRS